MKLFDFNLIKKLLYFMAEIVQHRHNTYFTSSLALRAVKIARMKQEGAVPLHSTLRRSVGR
jgi:hypothetical protein